MRRHLALCIAAGMAAALAAPAVSHAQTTITIGDNFFSPETATLDIGQGSFHWEWGPGGVGTSDIHNVDQEDGLFVSGSPTTNAPGGFSVIASAGSYPYVCDIHFEMRGEVSVRPVAADTTSGAGLRVTWADPNTTTGNRYDVRYKAGKKWKVWQEKTSKLSGTFGRNGKPTKLKGRVKLQARSLAGKARSDWSPTLVVQPRTELPPRIE